ncbi:AbrB/MazE/SpoVT family DNA-binding domain-containing protein [Candidatus Pacearchaeota archaeon]|nr:AbrB/MazE/SpoVT family DNA-binding domain-containing protein [Candidatus Pacearchaeota archaeon]
MVNINVTRISSKGQVVIPSNMRSDFREGEELLIVKDEDRIILKKVSKVSEQMKDDLEFAKRTDEALERVKSGKGIRMNFEDFLKEIKKW